MPDIESRTAKTPELLTRLYGGQSPYGATDDAKFTVGELFAILNLFIDVQTEKGSPGSGDFVLAIDGAASNALKKLDVANLAAAINQIGNLSDVTITSVATGEVLKWNGSAWVNNTLAEAGIAAAVHTHTESDITDLQAYLLAATVATLTNKTIDADTNTLSNLEIGSEVKTTLNQTQEIWIGAEAMLASATNGAEFASRELATNDVMISAFKFDAASSESAQFTWTPPNNWNGGTLRFKLYWTNAAGLTTETVDFDLAAVAFGNDDGLDAAFGTAQSVVDTWIAQDDLHVTGFSVGLTVGGSPVAGEMIVFRLSRDVASDDLTGDAEVIGLVLEYGINDIGTS